jgi:SAM-dependent methyltransferase
MSDRVVTLRAGIEPRMRGIEYGPSYSPLFPKAEGWNVIIVDHASHTELVKKYAQWGVATEKIEPVDVVLSDEAPIELQLAHAFGQFDYIVASHVFEHLPNPIAFLQTNHQLLRPGGMLRLAVPDKRFCFDLLKPLSTAGQLIQAHVEQRKRHTIGQYFDAISMHSLKAGQMAFPGACGTDDLALQNDPMEAYRIAHNSFHSPTYVDIHAWTYTPSSFSAIMRLLNASGLLDLVVETIESDGVYEFFVTLRKPLPGVAEVASAVPVREGLCHDLVGALNEERLVRFP